MKNQKKFLVVICGPTAIGKTDTAIKVAQHFNTEIISADSRQFYIETTIGTAKPTEQQLVFVHHHFINSLHIEQDYSAGAFEKDCIELLDKLFITHDVIVMVGGSGLYIDAALNGIDEVPKSDAKIRSEIEAELAQNGIAYLQNKLQQLDPVYCTNNDLNNTQRVIRALEVCIVSNKPFSSFLKKENAIRNFTPIFIGLNTDRQKLYNRINLRVEEMMQQGLLKECESLFEKRSLNALQTVGYKEIFDFFENKTSLEEAVNLIKQHTRNYAKRQLTWFNRYEDLKWFEPEEIEGIMSSIIKSVK